MKFNYEEKFIEIMDKYGLPVNSCFNNHESVFEFVEKFTAIFPYGSEQFEECRSVIGVEDYINRTRNEFILVEHVGTGKREYVLRSEAEWNPKYKQIVTLCILKEFTETKKQIGLIVNSGDYRQKLTFIGGHVSFNKDMQSKDKSFDMKMRANLVKEIYEEIGLKFSPESSSIVYEKEMENIIGCRKYGISHISRYHKPEIYSINVNFDSLGEIKNEFGSEFITLDLNNAKIDLHSMTITYLQAVEYRDKITGVPTEKRITITSDFDEWLYLLLNYYMNKSNKILSFA